MVNKYLALKGEKFDINKVTVVGSPTITSDGVASGFSSGNYITLGQGLLTNANTWELEFDYDATDVPDNTVGTIFQNVQTSPTYSGLVIQGRNYIITLFAGSGSGTTWDVVNAITVPIQYKAFNKIRLGYNGAKYYCFVNGVEKWSLQSDLKIAFPNTNCVIGYHSWWAALQYGSIDLSQFSITVDNQLVYTPTKPTYLLERRKPKVWNKNNYSVVGSPTITNDGLATYINGSNYVYIPPIDYTKPFAIKKMGFTRASWGGNYYFVNGGNTNKDYIGFVIGTNGSTQKLRWFLSSTGTNWNIANGWETVTALKLNTLYYVDLIYSGKDYTVILYDSYYRELERMTVNNSTPLYQSGQGIMFGSNFVGNGLFNGTINLANIIVENDGVVVFDGGAETYVYDPSKFTVVGSPTISEYGVASGFGNENYLKTKSSFGIPMANSWSIIFPTIKVNTYSKYFWGGDTRYGGIVLAVNSEGRIVVYMSSNGTTWDIASGADNLYSKLIFKNGDEVNLRIDFTGDKYVLYIFKDNVWQEQKTINSSLKLGNFEYFRIGQWVVGNNFDSSINLPSISIMVDNKEVFTGAKEQFYMMKG